MFILCGGLNEDWVEEWACHHLGLYPIKVQRMEYSVDFPIFNFCVFV